MEALKTIGWICAGIVAVAAISCILGVFILWGQNPDGRWCPDYWGRCHTGNVTCTDGAGKTTFSGRAVYGIKKRAWHIYPVDGGRFDTSHRCTAEARENE